jgi:hypothetical protein
VISVGTYLNPRLPPFFPSPSQSLASCEALNLTKHFSSLELYTT